MDYAQMPAMVQFALVDVEAHAHLARVEQASRMWRTVAKELRELSDSLRHELDCLEPYWKDATGSGFAKQVWQRKVVIDEMLTRIEQHQPWRALDDLARQLLLTRARVTETVERSADDGHEEAAAHLGDLDRYFLAAAEALLGAVGAERPVVEVDLLSPADGAVQPMLAGGPTLAGTTPMALDTGGSALPPGSVTIPGLLAVPPGAGLTGGGSRRITPSSIAGGRLSPGTGAGSAGRGSDPGGYDSSGFDPSSVAGGSGAAGGPDLPERIEQVADPVAISGDRAMPQAPQPPDPPAGSASGPGSGAGAGRMFPPIMMMPPFMPGAGRSTGRRPGTARSLEESERRTRASSNTPGVPARLRGRSALADPAGSGFRPVAMSGSKNTGKEPAVQEALDHEVWQVTNPGAASPLKPEPAEVDPRKLRRR